MKKILVIEDEADLREEIVTWLNLEGYAVTEAENGQKGLEIIMQDPPDMILSDIMMPLISGTEVLNFLMQKTDFNIPFLFMSALAERENIREGMRLGADDYITKPFTRAELLESIKTRIVKHQAHEQKKEIALGKLREQIILHLPHELRTPLNSIIGFGSMLASMPEHFSPKEIASFGDHIEKSGQRLHRLVENYLIYIQLEFRNEHEKNSYSGEHIELLTNEVIYNLKQLRKYPNDYKLFIQPGRELTIPEDYLRKVIFELTDNAFKFTDKDHDVILEGEQFEDHYLLKVINTGRGFRKNDIGEIAAFMQFERLKYEQQGSGFGLVIAKKMLEQCGGSLSIDSVPGEKTTVNCRIPSK